jgi:aminoglycoside 6'-N-acetyltransferase
METLHGDRVTLRTVTEADMPRLWAIASEPTVSPWWVGTTRESLGKEFLHDATAAFAIESDGEVIGAIEFWEENDPSYRYATIDLMVDGAHQGQGLGTDALRTVARHLFSRGHHHLMIDPAAVNERAIRAYEKVGFKRVGVMRSYELGPDGVWRDSLLMDMLPEDLR